MEGTPLRAMVETILRASQRPLGAYDLAHEISLRTGRKCHANSVYRCLAFLCANGSAYHIAVNNKFIVVDALTQPNSFTICSACDMVTAYLDGSTEQLIRHTAQNVGFSPKRIVIECVGICRACSDTSL
jgi:Fur family transcriptional regulator, zinc uptake regulator